MPPEPMPPLASTACARPRDVPAAEPFPAEGARRGKGKPRWSSLEAGFIRERTRTAVGHKGYGAKTVRQTEKTMSLWRELIGDRTIDRLHDGTDAGEFRDLMLRMPASHGKEGTRAEIPKVIPPMEAIRRADQKQKKIDERNKQLPPGAEREPDFPRLKMKTLKRHFSTLSRYWIYAGRLGLVPKNKTYSGGGNTRASSVDRNGQPMT